jgi:hypothetical protein
LENKSKDNKEKKILFFFRSPPEKLPEVAGVGRSLAVDGGRQRQLVAGNGWRWLLDPKDWV